MQLGQSSDLMILIFIPSDDATGSVKTMQQQRIGYFVSATMVRICRFMFGISILSVGISCLAGELRLSLHNPRKPYACPVLHNIPDFLSPSCFFSTQSFSIRDFLLKSIS